SLMAALLAAISTRDDDVQLVLVGDADQLPAVGTGDVLRQLTTSGAGVTQEQRALLRSVFTALEEAGAGDRTSGPGALFEAMDDADEGTLAAATARLRVRFRQATDESGRQIVALADRMARGEAPTTEGPEGIARVKSAGDL